jgi:hypothetical protein
MKRKIGKSKLLLVLMAVLFAVQFSAAGYAADIVEVYIKPTGGEISNVQLFNGRVFIAEEEAISVTDDLINYDVIDELTWEGDDTWVFPNIANYGDIIFFNNATMYSKDGVNFYPTVSDIELSNGLRYIFHWNGYYISIAEDLESNDVFMSSADGINWYFRGECEFDYAPDMIFEFNGALWVLDENYGEILYKVYDAYCTTDGVNFTSYPEIKDLFNGKGFVCAYCDGFIITDTYDDDEGVTYYVSNDMRNWRVLIKDGTLMEKTDWWFLSDYNEELNFDVLDNAMPGGLPLTKGNADLRKFTNDFPYLMEATNLDGSIYYGHKSVVTELSITDGVISEGINPGADITAIFRDEHSYNFSDSPEYAIYMSYDGGTTYQYGRGDIVLQGIATDGNGTFLCNAPGGVLLSGTLIRQGGKIDMDLRPYSFNPDGSGINTIKYLNGRYLLCTFAGGLYSSADGKAWRGEAALPETLNDIIYNGGYIAAGEDGIYTSPDLSQWTQTYKREDKYIEMRSVCLGRDGLLVAGGYRSLIYSEDNGATWNDANKTAEELTTIHSVIYGNGRYIATGGTGYGGNGQSFTSADGKNWEELHQGYEVDYEKDTNEDIFYRNVGYAGLFVQNDKGGFFALTGLNRSTDGHILTSEDGVSWDYNYLYRWGLDLCSPLDNLVAYLRSDSLVFADYGADGETPIEINVSAPVTLAEPLTPSNVITPLFRAYESWSHYTKY